MPSEEISEIVNRIIELGESERVVQDALLQIVFNVFEGLAEKEFNAGNVGNHIFEEYEERAEKLCSQSIEDQVSFILQNMSEDEMFCDLDLQYE